MFVFDRYMMRSILVTMLIVALSLTAIIFLTQSLRFLELVIESGASSAAFWQLTLLALPRFLEVILPLSLSIAVAFIYTKMIGDSEMVVLRGAGFGAMALTRPALSLAMVFTVLLMVMTMWLTPKSLVTMQGMQQVIKAQLSGAFFKEGVFNQIGTGMTLYVRHKTGDGELQGIMLYDSRDANMPPTTIVAKRGVLLANDDGFEVLVYDGARQDYDRKKRVLNRLDFERYTIALPNNDGRGARWVEPEERTILELINPDLSDANDVANLSEFRLEIQRRFLSPFLAITFTLIVCAGLLIGPYSRRGNTARLSMVGVAIIGVQGLYIAAFNIAKDSDVGVMLMYIVVIGPIMVMFFALSRLSEPLRRRWLYGVGRKTRSDVIGQA